MLDFAVVVGVGALGLLLLAALMPYGHPKPSASVVYIRSRLWFVVVPAILTAVTVVAGRELYLREWRRLGAALFFVPPFLGVPWLLMQMAL
jgi:hypothetical protein